MSGFLSLEGLLKDRLTELLPPTVRVMSAADVAGVQAGSQPTPAVQVFYGGYRVLESKADKRSAKISQTWYVVPVVRHAGSQVTGEAARQAAGPLLDACLDALLGWLPGPGYTPLELDNAPPPRWIKGGLGFHPLGFKTQRAVSTTQPRHWSTIDWSNTMSGLLCAGDFYFDRFDDSGNPTGWVKVGDAKQFAIAENSESVQRKSRGRNDYGQIKDSVRIRSGNSISIQFDEIAPRGLAIALLGSEAALAQSSATVTEEAVTAKHDVFVELANQDVSSVVVTNTGGSTTYVLGTDYEINGPLGLLMALSTGSITDAQALEVSYSAAAITGTSVLGGTRATVRGRCMLDGINLATQKPVIVRVFDASLGPDGEVDFSSEEFVSVGLTGEMSTPAGQSAPYRVDMRG